MLKSQNRLFVVMIAAGLLCLGTSISAQTFAAQELASVEHDQAGLFFLGKSHTEGLSLTVSTPDGVVHKYAFGPGEAPFFDLASIDAPDGSYNWELRPIAAPRDRADGVPLKRDAARIQSGGFWVSGGAIVTGGEEAPAPAKQGFQTKDQQILDDLIVDGSACVGQDCSNGESFGFDTLRLKENNLRLHFDDTSNTASFPSNDWRLIANDSSNGGANKFSIEDSTAGRNPFTVEAGAPVNSLYVEADGDVGVKTSNPVVDIHVVEGNTPTLRLEQDGSDGFTPQTFDVAANEANFFIRDVTNGSSLFFRAQPGAPENSLFIANDGDIGMGTNSPATPLEIRETTAANRTMLQVTNNGTTRIAIQDTRATGSTWFNSVNQTTYTVSQADTGGAEFEITDATTGDAIKVEFSVGDGSTSTAIAQLQADGDLDLLGVVGSLSDRNSKNNIVAVDTLNVLERVRELPISTWTYKKDQDSVHMGPMAQDFYAAFGLHESDTSIAISDLSGVALAAIQGLDAKLADKEAEVERLAAHNEELESRLAALEAMMAAIAGD